MSLIEQHDEVASVAFPYFGGIEHEHFTKTEHNNILYRNIPSRRLKLADGSEQLVATVYDLMVAHYSIDRGFGGDKEGGRLGQLSNGQTVPEFERQVFSLPEGLAPSPIETRYGYHIVRIDRRVDGRRLAYDQVKDKIADYLNECVRRTALNQYVQQLIGKAEIIGIDLNATDSPLLQ